MARWVANYGPDRARDIAEAHLAEPALDLTQKQDSEPRPDGLTGTLLATGSFRLANAGRIDALAGFDDGVWWVQDAAAALPARLFGEIAGQSVLDLCAAPGGKTAQLCAAGAIVTALDSSASRMKRVKDNLKRLSLDAELVVADVITWNGGQFDAGLLDAPCSSTGTIRRHPDIPYLKSPNDIAELAVQQAGLLTAAADRVAAGGRLIFCTCSLEPDEGQAQISEFLSKHANFTTDRITSEELNCPSEWITDEGFLRTFPYHDVPLATLGDPPSTGLDGFFAARLKRTS
jgi:16S rRNA (cytosine967-C5)-methyltransferase